MSDLAQIERAQQRRWAALGGSHDRLIKFLQVALPMVTGALAALLVFAPLTQRGEVSFLLAKDSVDIARERMRVTSALYRGEDALGRPFALSAASAVQKSSAEPIVDLTGMSAAINLQDGLARLVAGKGRYDMRAERVSVVGPVTFDAADGYHLETADVDIDLKSRAMASTRPVSGRMPVGTFRANRLVADLDTRVVRLEGAARLRINQGALR